VLFRRSDLDRIKAGDVTLAFRRWKGRRAKPGGRQRTAVGELAIGAVTKITEEDLTDSDARRAGYADLAALRSSLDRGDGEIWRIELSFAGEDPRRALRERADLDDAELAGLTERLVRFDRASRHGPWTRATLELIAAQPEVRAADLAASQGREKLPFKRDVRKLKELGLTESLERGYRLSPRGSALLERWRSERPPD
jgi:hypothetical protein